MENLKFRVWNGETMISPDYITRDGVAFWSENSIPTTSKNVMQYTGVNDRANTEIYKWDILRSNVNVNSHIARYVVCFVSGAFRLWLIDKAEVDDSNPIEFLEWISNNRNTGKDIDEPFGEWQLLSTLINQGEKLKVVGNVYENPSLLTAGIATKK